MNQPAEAQSASGTPIHLWIVGVTSLLWNSMGVFDFLATRLQLGFYMDNFTEEQLAYFHGFPSWVVLFWALGVGGAFFGSLALLFRSRWAIALFAASLVGILVTGTQNFFLSDGAEIMGTGGIIFSVVLIGVTVFLIQYARIMTRRGVLR